MQENYWSESDETYIVYLAFVIYGFAYFNINGIVQCVSNGDTTVLN